MHCSNKGGAVESRPWAPGALIFATKFLNLGVAATAQILCSQCVILRHESAKCRHFAVLLGQRHDPRRISS